MALVFVGYSHKDEQWRQELEPHLAMLRAGLEIEFWSDLQINPGDNWRQQIFGAIERANIAVLLISADFLSSDFILDEEVPRLLAREPDGLRIIPLIVRFSAWRGVPWLEGRQLWPRDATPLAAISRKRDREQCLASFADMLRQRVRPIPRRSPRDRIIRYIQQVAKTILDKYWEVPYTS